jgi:hypothetical protein
LVAVDPESAAVVVLLFSIRLPDPKVAPPSSRGADGLARGAAGFCPEHAAVIAHRITAVKAA